MWPFACYLRALPSSPAFRVLLNSSHFACEAGQPADDNLDIGPCDLVKSASSLPPRACNWGCASRADGVSAAGLDVRGHFQFLVWQDEPLLQDIFFHALSWLVSIQSRSLHFHLTSPLQMPQRHIDISERLKIALILPELATVGYSRVAIALVALVALDAKLSILYAARKTAQPTNSGRHS